MNRLARCCLCSFPLWKCTEYGPSRILCILGTIYFVAFAGNVHVMCEDTFDYCLAVFELGSVHSQVKKFMFLEANSCSHRIHKEHGASKKITVHVLMNEIPLKGRNEKHTNTTHTHTDECTSIQNVLFPYLGFVFVVSDCLVQRYFSKNQNRTHFHFPFGENEAIKIYKNWILWHLA